MLGPGDPLGLGGGMPLVPPWAAQFGLHPPPTGFWEDYLDPASPYFHRDAAAFVSRQAQRGHAARQAAQAQRRQADERGVAAAEAAAAAQPALAASTDPGEIADLVKTHGDFLPDELVRAVWQRAVDTGLVKPTSEFVTVEGRPTIAGYFLSRGTYTTQFGRWGEIDRQPAFPAKAAGRHTYKSPDSGSASTVEGYDLWLDAAGDVWGDGNNRPTDDGYRKRPARIAVKDGKSTARLVVAKGAPFAPSRSKAPSMGWEMLVPNARTAYPAAAGNLALAVATALRQRPA